MARRFRLGLIASAIALGLAVLAPIAASIPRGPALGNWEGVGPHGLPLSFVLARSDGRVVLSRLVVGFPLNCPGKPTPTVAVAYPRASYGGPGAPPRVRINWKPGDIIISAFTGGFPLSIYGRLLATRRAVLSMGADPKQPKRCGWPQKVVTWSVRPRQRLAVETGRWTGTVAAPDGVRGTVTVKVGAAGRIVDFFQVRIMCPGGGGGGGFTSGPPAEEFISATGAFEGWGYAHWHGRFGADGALRGTFTYSDQCGTGEQVDGTFIAQHT